MTDLQAKLFSIPKWSPCLLGTIWRSPETGVMMIVVGQDMPEKDICEGVYVRGFPHRQTIHAFQPVEAFMQQMERVQ